MAHQPNPLKILAIGSPLGNFSLLSSKVTAINSKHGPFDACIIVGDVFAEGSDGKEIEGLKLPVPTYFTIGKYALPEAIQEKIVSTGGEVANNLVFLGKSSVLTTAQGLKIACVGGKYDASIYDHAEENAYTPAISKASITTLLSHSLFNPQQTAATTSADRESLASARDASQALPSAFTGIDLLITTSPPPNLSMLSPSFPSSGIKLADPAPPLTEVVNRGRPRYIFWSDGKGFWERQPFGWSSSSPTGLGGDERWTRAVKLGSLGDEEVDSNGKKARWFYAFTLPAQTPSAVPPIRPVNATPNPFSLPVNPKKRAALDDQSDVFDGDAKRSKGDHSALPDNYVCKICSVPGHRIQDCPQKGDKPAPPPPGYICKICQSPDHHIRDCPQKDAADAQKRVGGRPPPAGYVCRACGMQDAHYIRECPVVAERDQQRAKKKELGPAECWFCLSNPKVTKHLIVAIGQETYVTLPKGQLIPTQARHLAQDTNGPLVPGGGHVLIIPIAHHPTLLSIPQEDAMSIISEIEGYKSSLRQLYAKHEAVPVTFEVGRLSGRGGHAHVQVVPVPKALADKVVGAFRAAGEKKGIDWEAEPERALARVGQNGNYFKVECPDGTKLVHLLKGNFDLQFGRWVLAGLLGYHNRVDWKDCSQTDEEDKKDAQDLKKAFAPFHS